MNIFLISAFPSAEPHVDFWSGNSCDALMRPFAFDYKVNIHNQSFTVLFAKRQTVQSEERLVSSLML